MIKEARLTDADRLVGFMQNFYQESQMSLDKTAAKSAFEEILNDPSLGKVWLVESNSEEVGYIVLTPGFSMEFYGKDGFIDDFYIEEAYRGKGIGSKVIQQVESHAKSIGLKALHLETSVKTKAKEFYESAGYKLRDGNHLMSKIL